MRLSLVLFGTMTAAVFNLAPSAGDDKKADKTTVTLWVGKWSPTSDYKPFPNACIYLKRGEIAAPFEKPVKSDKDGKVEFAVANGEPVTVLVLFDRKYVPEVQNLAARGGEHKLEIALIPTEEHLKRESADPNYPRAYSRFDQGARVLSQLPANDPDVKKDREEMREGKKETRPKSSAHPSITNPPMPNALGPQEKKVVLDCADLIRKCQLKSPKDAQRDGAIRMTSAGGGMGPALLDPHLAAQAVLGLLAAQSEVKSLDAKGARAAADLDVVRGWLLWYAANVDAMTGVPPRYDGLAHQMLKRLDDMTYDPDACAARFLLVVARYHRAAKKLPDEVARAARASFELLEGLAQEDELFQSRPGPVKLFTNNVEVYAALVEIGHYFASLNNPRPDNDADRAFAAADRLATAMAVFRKPDFYSFAVHAPKQSNPRLTDKEPEQGAANLYGLAYFPPEKPAGLWAAIQKEFTPEVGNTFLTTSERWLVAARRGNPADVKAWLKTVTDEAAGFGTSTYAHRPGGVIVALVDGPARLPDVLPPEAPK